MSDKISQSQDILGTMKPSRAIVKLAVPATLPCWQRPFTILWIPLILEC